MQHEFGSCETAYSPFRTAISYDSRDMLELYDRYATLQLSTEYTCANSYTSTVPLADPKLCAAMTTQSPYSSTSNNVMNVRAIDIEPRFVAFPVAPNPVLPRPASEAQCALPPNLCVEPNVAACNLSPATGDCIHLKCPTTVFHYGMRVVAYCEITSLHRVVYDSNEGFRWDDVNLNRDGLDWNYAVDQYASARTIFPTHPKALLGRIVHLSDEDDDSVSFSRTALVQQYCPASNFACVNRCVPCRMNLSTLHFVVFYVRSAITELRDFTNTSVTIVCQIKWKRWKCEYSTNSQGTYSHSLPGYSFARLSNTIYVCTNRVESMKVKRTTIHQFTNNLTLYLPQALETSKLILRQWPTVRSISKINVQIDCAYCQVIK